MSFLRKDSIDKRLNSTIGCRFYFSAVQNTLDSIAYIVKGNILCIVESTLVLLPEVPELSACNGFQR